MHVYSGGQIKSHFGVHAKWMPHDCQYAYLLKVEMLDIADMFDSFYCSILGETFNFRSLHNDDEFCLDDPEV